MTAITSQPERPAWDVDADWWGPTWDVVQPVGPAESARPARTGTPRDPVPELSAVPASVSPQPADPSWGRILATTISLWVSRRSSPVHLGGRRDAGAPGRARFGRPRAPSADASVMPACAPAVGASGSPARRPRVAGRASAAWGAHARLLSAAMLSVGLLAAGAGSVGLVVAHASAAPAVRLAARPSPVPVPSDRTIRPVTLSAVPQTPKPVWLTIPAIGVKAPIVTLGLNRNGTLQVPSTTKVVGWYTNSPRPGATGSAVIAGHVDSRSGPGVFFWLRTMHPGERIYVRRADGTLAVFTVTAVRLYAKSQFPTAMVYGPVPDAELRLITCGGTFDYARGTYLSNVVVYARLSA